MISASVLTYYDCYLPLRMAGDASTYGFRSRISHVMKDQNGLLLSPMAKLVQSRKIKLSWRKKHCHFCLELEDLPYLYGWPFSTVLDHKPLTAFWDENMAFCPWQLLECSFGPYHLLHTSTQLSFNRQGPFKCGGIVKASSECSHSRLILT